MQLKPPKLKASLDNLSNNNNNNKQLIMTPVNATITNSYFLEKEAEQMQETEPADPVQNAATV